MKAYSEAFCLAFGCNKQKIDREKAIKVLEAEVKRLKEERQWIEFVTPPSPSSRPTPPSFSSPSLSLRENLSQCQCLLGMLLWQRRNPDSSDLKDAVKLGTESKDPRKYYYLGFIAKEQGDDEQSRKCFQMAYSYLNDQIGKDEPWEMFMLAKLYSEKDIGLENDMKQSFLLFQCSGEMGFAPAQHNVGFLYHNGLGVEKDLVEAAKWYQKAALQGMVSAQYNLALLLMEGNGGIEKDAKEALRLLLLCADAGFAQAYYMCAQVLASGVDGVERDPELALDYLRKAANRGDVDAEYLLGLWCKEGKFVDQDYKEALRLFQQAAQKGHGYALYMIGVIFDGGFGEIENKTEAVNYYKQAAEKGIAEAQYALGECYGEGVGVTQNPAEAFRLYKASADQDIAIAQYSVAACYEAGVGVAQNSAIATLYFNKARGKGYVGPAPASKLPFASESLPDLEALQKLAQENPAFMEQMLQQLITQYPQLLSLLAQPTEWTCGECTFKNSGGQSCEMCRKPNPNPLPFAIDMIQTVVASSQHSPTPASQGPDETTTETTSCPVCTFPNESGASQCLICGSSF